MKQRYNALKGTCDILPGEIGRWRFLETTTRELFSRYGFLEIRTPLIESTELFARSVGESTDIVHKEMYTFKRGKESVSLRPENTASVVRAFVQHSLFRTVASGYPERYFYIGPMFRYENPQAGRQRQFHQIGAEVLGSLEPLADAETIQMLWSFLEELGIHDRELVINSLGDLTCHEPYRNALVEWLKPRADSLCNDCKRRTLENPLRVFDCKVAHDREILSEAPSVLDHLDEASATHFEEVKLHLDRYGISYRVDDRMVRGLDYYTRTVFEVVSSGLGAQNAILGGGRYDGLVEDIGGPSNPAFGFAVGMERLLALMPEDRTETDRVDLAIIALGREGWDEAILMAKRLRTGGVGVLMPLAERPLGAQIKRADRTGARYALFVGKDELEKGVFGLKDLRTGEQTETGEDGLVEILGRHE